MRAVDKFFVEIVAGLGSGLRDCRLLSHGKQLVFLVYLSWLRAALAESPSSHGASSYLRSRLRLRFWLLGVDLHGWRAHEFRTEDLERVCHHAVNYGLWG